MQHIVIICACLAFGFLGILTFGELAIAETFVVDDDEGAWVDYSNIQNAINRSEDGDIIRVFSGVYNESIVVNSSLSLVGNGSTYTFIHGIEETDAIKVTSDNVTITRLFITNTTRPWWSIKIYGSNCTISDNVVTNQGIMIFNGNHTLIERNLIYRNRSGPELDGIWLRESNYNLVQNNTISNLPRSINVINSNYNTIRWNNLSDNHEGFNMGYSNNNTVRGNRITNTSVGISLYRISHSKFDSNILTHGKNAFECVGSKSIVISNNYCANFTENGIDLWSCHNNTINNNTIISTSNYGINLEHHSYQNEINNNTINNSLKYGIHLYTSYDNSIIFNEISNSTSYGIYIGYIFEAVGISVINLVYQNILRNNGGFSSQGYDESPFDSQWDNGTIGNYWSDYNGSDSNGDGIGDTPYLIDGFPGNIEMDQYPLMDPNGTWTVPDEQTNEEPDEEPFEEPDDQPNGDPDRSAINGSNGHDPQALVSIALTIGLIALIGGIFSLRKQ